MLQRLIIPIAIAGFAASTLSQIGFWLGYDLFGAANSALFVGIFAIWLPTVLFLQKSIGGRPSTSWAAALTGAPAWMTPALYAVFAYGLVNFALGFFGVVPIEANFWRVGTSHAMIFYFAAWAFNAAAIGREEQGYSSVCERGHDMPIGARHCSECGAIRRSGTATRSSLAS